MSKARKFQELWVCAGLQSFPSTVAVWFHQQAINCETRETIKRKQCNLPKQPPQHNTPPEQRPVLKPCQPYQPYPCPGHPMLRLHHRESQVNCWMQSRRKKTTQVVPCGKKRFEPYVHWTGSSWLRSVVQHVRWKRSCNSLTSKKKKEVLWSVGTILILFVLNFSTWSLIF